jgi:flagellar motor switch protein FliG
MRLNKQGISAYQNTIKKKPLPMPTPKKETGKKQTAELHKSKKMPGKNTAAAVAVSVPQGKKGKRRAAELLLLMGKDEAANVLKHMPAEDVEQVIKELAEIRSLSRNDIETTLNAFGEDAQSRGLFQGGPDVALGFLKVAFGDEEGERILRNATPAGKPFAFLEELEKDQLNSLLKDESIETLAVILPRIDPAVAKEILQTVSVIYQGDLIKRIAQGRKVDGSIIARIEDVLQERLRRQGGKIERAEVDGRRALAEILRHMNSEESERIMEVLPEEVMQEIEDHIFNIDTLHMIADRDFQDILRSMNEQEIALLLKAKDKKIRAKFMRNMSEGKRHLVEKEEASLPPMRKSEVDKLTREFLDKLKEMERKGQLVLLRDNEEFV